MKILTRVFTGILLLALVFLGGLSVFLAYKELNSDAARLVPTQAVVLSRDVHEYDCNTMGKVGGRCRDIQLQFTYKIDGVTTTSTPVFAEVESGTYAVGDEVTLFIDPKNPEKAYLQPLDALKTGLGLSVLGFIFIGGLAYFLSSRKL